MSIIFISILVGAVLGLRFTVLIVVPAAMIAFVLAVATAWLQNSGLAGAAALVLAVETALQLGYLFGVLIRYTMLAARVPESAGAKSRPILPWST